MPKSNWLPCKSTHNKNKLKAVEPIQQNVDVNKDCVNIHNLRFDHISIRENVGLWVRFHNLHYSVHLKIMFEVTLYTWHHYSKNFIPNTSSSIFVYLRSYFFMFNIPPRRIWIVRIKVNIRLCNLSDARFTNNPEAHMIWGIFLKCTDMLIVIRQASSSNRIDLYSVPNNKVCPTSPEQQSWKYHCNVTFPDHYDG